MKTLFHKNTLENKNQYPIKRAHQRKQCYGVQTMLADLLSGERDSLKHLKHYCLLLN